MSNKIPSKINKSVINKPIIKDTLGIIKSATRESNSEREKAIHIIVIIHLTLTFSLLFFLFFYPVQLNFQYPHFFLF